MSKLYVIKMAYDKMKVDVAKCHACHAKRRWMISPSTTPITQNEGGCYQVPRLPHKTKVDITKYHACHAKCRSLTGDQSNPCAPPEPAQCPPQIPCLPYETKVDVTKCHTSCKTKIDNTKCRACRAKCRGITGDQWSPSAPPEPAQCPKCHACHAKRRWMLSSTTPAT